MKSKASYSAPCHNIVDLVEFCHFEWASTLLAIASGNRVTIASCKFPEENPELEDFEYQELKSFHHNTHVLGFSWSPATSLVSVPKVIKFSTAGADHKVYSFYSDLDSETSKQVVTEHKDYINSIAVHPDNGEQVASVSDDLTCKISAADGSEPICFPLTSPGVSVTWNTEQTDKVMVAERKGVIRFYSVVTQQPVLSVECGHSPLACADWSRVNPLLISAISGSDWFVFDTSRSSRPLANNTVHVEGGHRLRWSPAQRHLLASTGQPGSQLKVTNVHSNQTLLCRDHVIASGLTWHHRLPFVAIGGDRIVNFYKIEII